MNLKIALLGELPPHCEEALNELREDLSLELHPDGIPLYARKGEELILRSDGSSIEITWGEPVHFYRAVSLLPVPFGPCDIREKPCFEKVGMMIDASRNAVLKPEALKLFFRKMALMGINLGMMYTEETYEVCEYPYFGYQRGRYSQEELRALDDYADLFGIELCPCIQTLGHLNRLLHWPAMGALRDNDEVLLADQEETYQLIRQMLVCASAPYHSRRIHIGMDEAHGVGMGRHLMLYGYERPYEILRRHLERVARMAFGLGLSPMMWSDMYFRLESPTNDYYNGPMPSAEAARAVVPGVDLVYWDYYHRKEEEYALQLERHRCLNAPTVFAGGIWTWSGPAPDYEQTFTATLAALTACKKAGVPLVFATAWGDNGAEANLRTSLLGLQMYAEFTYEASLDREWLAKRLQSCCHADAEAFWNLTLFNRLPGMQTEEHPPVNAAKLLLYQDPLVQLFTEDLKEFSLEEHYLGLASLYGAYAKQGGEFAALWRFYENLAEVLAKKCRWHEQASGAVLTHNLTLARELADGTAGTIASLDRLRLSWQELWDSTNKPFGFEVLDGRLGWVKARLETAGRRMDAYAEGRACSIPELEQTPLPYLRGENGVFSGCLRFGDIASACKIDG